MSYINKMSLRFSSLNENESFARLAVASFCSNKLKNLEDISDIKTVVSEAVTNCVVHAYAEKQGEIIVNCEVTDEQVKIEVIDNGIGISDIDKARTPFFTTKPEKERSGMGFTVMEGFVDEMLVESKLGEGTKITLIKKIK